MKHLLYFMASHEVKIMKHLLYFMASSEVKKSYFTASSGEFTSRIKYLFIIG
jgi:hypothetical protein